jgi:glutathione S-transferase
MLRLYDYLESGNAYKVRLLLAQLAIPFERVPLDILQRETRTPEFLVKNPNGRIPVLEWPDGRTLAESNAILFHLAEGTPLLPASPWERAQALRWMFFEQYSHEPYIAVVRFWHFAGRVEENRALLAEKMRLGNDALAVMEQHLGEHEYFAGARYSVADIALYAYTHVAEEGRFDLQPYPALRAWLERVRRQPRHIGIDDEVGKLVTWSQCLAERNAPA